MASAVRPKPDAAGTLSAHAYTVYVRIVAGVLVAISRASLPAIAITGLLAPAPIPLFGWARRLGAFALLPGVAAWLINLTVAADIEVRSDEVVVRRRGFRFEIPCASIACVKVWAVPLPGAGLWLRMRSGRRFRYGLQAADPTALLSAVAGVCGADGARAALQHPTIIYAQAKRHIAPTRWYHLLGKFPGFALLPGLVMFNLDQHVTYGGTFGQYYLEGFGPYLKHFSIYWGLNTVYLLLYASVWRAAAESASVLAAWLVRKRAATVRRVAEIVCLLVYYVGVPVLLALPFLR